MFVRCLLVVDWGGINTSTGLLSLLVVDWGNINISDGLWRVGRALRVIHCLVLTLLLILVKVVAFWFVVGVVLGAVVWVVC